MCLGRGQLRSWFGRHSTFVCQHYRRSVMYHQSQDWAQLIHPSYSGCGVSLNISLRNLQVTLVPE